LRKKIEKIARILFIACPDLSLRRWKAGVSARTTSWGSGMVMKDEKVLRQ
jgi:hypothetical protein